MSQAAFITKPLIISVIPLNGDYQTEPISLNQPLIKLVHSEYDFVD